MKKNFCLIGYPLSHTFSKKIHQDLFKEHGVEASYDIHEITESQLNEKIQFIKNYYDGFNVTAPYKTKIMDYLDQLDKSAVRYGAVNTVAKVGGKYIGYNTDILGFEKTLEIHKINLEKSVCILGFGAVAKAIVYYLTALNLEVTVAIRNHTLEKENIIKSYYKTEDKIFVTDINNIAGHFDLLINATPVGMYPEDNKCAVDKKTLYSIDFVFDLIYNPETTKLMRLAKECGCKTCNGREMLIWQARGAQEIWLNGYK